MDGGGRRIDVGGGATLTVAGLWVFAFGTAMFSAASERQLRKQKYDLSRLSAMVARVDTEPEAADIPALLLDELCSTFGFARGVVLASPHGDLELVAWTEREIPTDLAAGIDASVSRAWEQRATQLLRAFDPDTDPRLASLVPDARNVLVVPLLRDRRQGLGAVVVERGSEHPSMQRWEVAMVEQFAEHAALTLHNAWLTEERESQLRIIQGLEQQLRAHNEQLETTVADRTEELRDVIANLREIDEQRRKLLEHVVHAAEDERTRIAHDIHDDPVQKMAALKMRLELFRKTAPGLVRHRRGTRGHAGDHPEHADAPVRPQSSTLEEEGLGSALTYLLENSNSPFDWTVDDDMDEEPAVQTSLILYRIAQEAFANARKHAQATQVRVTLQRRDGGTSMRIVDDGVGFMPQEAVVAAPGHLGLAAIRGRAEMAGGSSTLWSLPGQGTTLEVWLPHDAADPVDTTAHDDENGVADVLPLPGPDARRRVSTSAGQTAEPSAPSGLPTERRSHGTHPVDARGRRGPAPRSDVRARLVRSVHRRRRDRPRRDGGDRPRQLHEPDVALLDVRMPGGGGSRAAREIRRRSPETRIVAFSATTDPRTVASMVRAGAVGYVGKDQPGDEVLRAIHRSADGRSSIAVDRLGEVAERLAEHQASQVVQIAERARVSTERIEEAIHGDVLAMVFQPIVELRSGRVRGVEALARFMTRPRRSPETWFAEAASHGLLAQLELAAATRAFEHLDRIPEGVYLSVNFSPETICDPRIAPLLQTGPADRVVVELTERSPIAEHDEARACLDDIRALGVRLAIDDVGSGFSGLGQVVDLSPDLIKLDRSLVASLDSDDTKRALVARLTSFAVEVGMEVVAEGIETEAELDTLRSLGVETGQGFLLGRPGPIPDAVDGSLRWPRAFFGHAAATGQSFSGGEAHPHTRSAAEKGNGQSTRSPSDVITT